MSLDHAVQRARNVLLRAGVPDPWVDRLRRMLRMRHIAKWLKAQVAKNPRHRYRSLADAETLELWRIALDLEKRPMGVEIVFGGRDTPSKLQVAVAVEATRIVHADTEFSLLGLFPIHACLALCVTLRAATRSADMIQWKLQP